MQKECNVCHMVFSEEDIIKHTGTNDICPVCHTKGSFLEKYIMDIKRISNDPDFVQAMTKLHDEDPIEYQLKMSQFKANLGQQESSKKEEEDNNTPHCPYCNSTNIKKITTGSKVAHTALFGIFSMSRNSKQWHCNDCKSDF